MQPVYLRDPKGMRRAIRAARRRIGCDAEELGRRLGVAGSTVRKWEAGLAVPAPRHRRRYVEDYCVDPAAFDEYSAAELGGIIREARRRAGARRADVCRSVPVSERQYMRVESGQSVPRPSTLVLIALGLAGACPTRLAAEELVGPLLKAYVDNGGCCAAARASLMV